MDSARADALSARNRLAAGRWIARHAESFRHLPPPGAEVWLGDDLVPEHGCDASPLAGAGWTLHPIGLTQHGRIGVDARWLDATDPAQRADLFEGLPLPGDDDAAPFAWAHRALVRQGLRLRIGGASGRDAGGVGAQTVWLQLRRQPRSEVEAPLLVIELLPGVRCVLIESHERASQCDESLGNAPGVCRRAIVQNLQVHVRLGQGASLQHLRVATPGPDDRIAHHVSARLYRDARYDQALIASGAAYHLQRTVLELQGGHASARSAAVLFAAGSTLEQQVQPSHTAAGTRSAVETLALAAGSARVVVNASTRIAPGADEAAVQQRLAGIPTGGQPKIVLRPHLEILHDQVQARHGATWGTLPEEALFHARQRGLDERHARALIVEGMAQAVLARGLDTPEVLDTLGIEALVARIVGRHLGSAPETIHG